MLRVFRLRPRAAGGLKISVETPPKYGIRGIPTLMIFKDGNVEATKVGAVSKSQLADFIENNVGGG